MARAGTSKASKKIVYLFGAGATHAELARLYSAQFVESKFVEKNGLLMNHVSKRVCKGAKEDGVFPKQIKNLLSPAGLSNIELFISLIEKNQVKSESTINELKKRIKKDIEGILTKRRRQRFCLHKSLIELHRKIKKEEQLLGFISLNYDQVLDEAYQTVEKKEPDYGLSSEGTKGTLLLKLHGGFNLMHENRPLPIITPGINKNYLELPYNFIWGRALRLLIQCDILRVIGCSLSQNDVGVVDLFVKACLARTEEESFLIQIIDFDPDNNHVKENYGFLPTIETALDIEGGLISDQSIKDYTTHSNPFEIWLKAKVRKMLSNRQIGKTQFIKTVFE